MAEEEDYDQFLTLHKGQLIVAGIPEQFWKNLHVKLKNEVSLFFTIGKLILFGEILLQIPQILDPRGN